MGTPVPEGGKSAEAVKNFTYERGKCLVCGSEISQKGEFEGNVFCSRKCRSTYEKAGGYLEPDTRSIQRCPQCGMRMLGSLPLSEHCGNRGVHRYFRPASRGAK